MGETGIWEAPSNRVAVVPGEAGWFTFAMKTTDCGEFASTS